MPATKTPLPSTARLEHYIAYGALGAAALALAVLVALLVCRRGASREPIAIPEYAIVHTPWSRLKNMAWAVASTMAAFLVTRALEIDDRAGAIVQAIRSALTALFSSGTP